MVAAFGPTKTAVDLQGSLVMEFQANLDVQSSYPCTSDPNITWATLLKGPKSGVDL